MIQLLIDLVQIFPSLDAAGIGGQCLEGGRTNTANLTASAAYDSIMALENSSLSLLISGCRPRSRSLPFVVAYCLSLSSAFVASLYYFVPREHRYLPRDDARQIRSRMMAVGIVSVAAILAYPRLFCSDTTTEGATNARWGEGEGGDDDGESSGGGASGYLPGALRILGWSWSARRDLSITLHAAALYLGPIFALLLDRLVPARVPSPPHRAAPPSYPTSSRRWSKFRDLVFALS